MILENSKEFVTYYVGRPKGPKCNGKILRDNPVQWRRGAGGRDGLPQMLNTKV